MFKERKVKKEYLAIVEGVAGGVGESRTLHNYYAKDEKARKAIVREKQDLSTVFECKAESPAPTKPIWEIITKYTVLATNNTHSYLRVEPITGRFHQIRAHLAFVGHPLAGDKKYGGKPTKHARNQLLHCHRLCVDYNMGMSFEAPMPENFARCTKEWFTGVT